MARRGDGVHCSLHDGKAWIPNSWICFDRHGDGGRNRGRGLKAMLYGIIRLVSPVFVAVKLLPISKK